MFKIIDKNSLEGSIVGAYFLNPNITFARNEWLSCSVSIGESHNTRDILKTSVVVHTNLAKLKNIKGKQK